MGMSEAIKVIYAGNDMTENKKSSEINSKLFWCGKQDLNLHELAFTRT